MHTRLEAWPRAARLKRQRLIRPLFKRKQPDTYSISAGTIRILYRTVPRALTGTDAPIQAGFATGRQPSAVQRNAVRRTLREAFRTSPLRHALPVAPDQALTLMVLCRSRKDSAHAQLRTDLHRAMEILSSRLSR